MTRSILAIRLLPPIAIGRFGSSPTPLENYNLVTSEKDPKAFREISPAITLKVGKDGTVREKMPRRVTFRDANGRIKPVAPFFEVWAQFRRDGDFEPLTNKKLRALKISLRNLKWQVTAINRKASRRTGDKNDVVEAKTELFSHHEKVELIGACKNFKAGKSICFGHVQFIKPGATSLTSIIRLRFTPGQGQVFGPKANDPRTNDDVYRGATSERFREPPQNVGRWDRYHTEDTDGMPVTAPEDIFQGEWIGLNKDEEGSKLSHGYFDDSCDGIVTVHIDVPDGSKRKRRLEAYARFASAVPDFAPDSLPVRSILDDIEQMVLGTDPRRQVVTATSKNKKRNAPAFKRELVDILRRALETVRQMNTVVANGTQSRPNHEFEVGGTKVNEQNLGFRIFGKSPGRFPNEGPYELFPTDPLFHPDSNKQIYSYRQVVGRHVTALEQASRADGPSSSRVFYFMRMPDDFSVLLPSIRQKMPAFMRGSEGLELCLTRRQLAIVALAAGVDLKSAGITAPPEVRADGDDASGRKQPALGPKQKVRHDDN